VTDIDWQPWATEPFQRARRRRLPVLLLLTAGWAPGCRELERHLAGNAACRAVVDERFVPVRVDVDWRPDIADRYGLESWPTLLALSPDGHVLAGGVPPTGDLTSWLIRTAEAFAHREGVLSEPAATAAGSHAFTGDDGDARAEAWAALGLALDPSRGAFGSSGQPALSPSLAALAGSTVGVALYEEAALRTVDLLLDSPRWDEHAGLLRIRGASAWEPGADLARLEEQAEWVRLLAHATGLVSTPRWDAALDAAVRALRTAFSGSGPAWQPWTGGGPHVVFVDAMARACRALLLASARRGEAAWALDAITALEAVLPHIYTRGAGLAHALATRPHGPALLLDAMLTAHALLDADTWRSDPVYRDLAEELLLNAEARLLQPDGALADRRRTMAGANDVGRLADVLCPIEGNAEAARLSIRLTAQASDQRATGRDRARRILRGIHPDVRVAGGFAAPAALAWAAWDAPDDAISVW
jgi:uncharacterized protein YyaL (SSP411 family)